MRHVLLACAVLLLAAPAIAGDAIDLSDLLRPGLWAVTSSNIMNGKAAEPVTMQQCLTIAQVRDFANYVMSGGGDDATVEGFRRDGNRITFTVKVKMEQAVMTMRGDMQFPTMSTYYGIYHFTTPFQGGVMEGETRFDGKRIGDCRAKFDDNG